MRKAKGRLKPKAIGFADPARPRQERAADLAKCKVVNMAGRACDKGPALHVRQVSDRFMRQVKLESEAAGVPMRVWVLELVCKAIGMDPADASTAKRNGKPSRAEQAEEAREQAERQAVIDAWEQRKTCEAPNTDAAGGMFFCKLARDHAGDCAPAPPPVSRP